MAASAPPDQTERKNLGWVLREFGFDIILLAYVFLHLIDRSNILFPLWSSIAFPIVVVSPFIILNQRGPVSLKIVRILLIIVVLIPILGLKDSFYLELVIQIAIFAAMAIGLNVVVGFAGLLDLGYVAFFAVGAYLWGVFTSNEKSLVTVISGAQAAPEMFWLFLFIGVIAAAITGILLGLPVLRLRGDYLAIVTLGFGEMIRILVSNLSDVSATNVKINITNGAQGLPGIDSPPLPPFLVDAVRSISTSLGFQVSNHQALTYHLFYYFLVLLVGLGAAIVATRLDNSPIGRAWTAIREDETAAVAMGVPRVRMKLLAFAIGASFAGAMGVIFAAKQTFVSPESFSFIQSIFILAIVIVGGMGSTRGVILGAIVVTLLNLQVLKNFSLLINNLKNIDWVVPIINFPIRDWPAQLEPARYERFVFGLLLIIMMIFRPAGVLPAKRRKLELAVAMGKEPLPEAEAEAEPKQQQPSTGAIQPGVSNVP